MERGLEQQSTCILDEVRSTGTIAWSTIMASRRHVPDHTFWNRPCIYFDGGLVDKPWIDNKKNGYIGSASGRSTQAGRIGANRRIEQHQRPSYRAGEVCKHYRYGYAGETIHGHTSIQSCGTSAIPIYGQLQRSARQNILALSTRTLLFASDIKRSASS